MLLLYNAEGQFEHSERKSEGPISVGFQVLTKHIVEQRDT